MKEEHLCTQNILQNPRVPTYVLAVLGTKSRRRRTMVFHMVPSTLVHEILCIVNVKKSTRYKLNFVASW